MTTLFEYVTSGDYRDPDAPTVAVTTELLETAVEYHIENLSASERRELLENYVYEQCVENWLKHSNGSYAQSIVEEYIDDHQPEYFDV